MKHNRRTFLKKSFFTSIAAAVGIPIFSDSIYAAPYKLNHKPEPELWNDSEINISWLGHSTMLINFYGKIILTDPVLMDNVGLYFFGTSFGPSRLTPPALRINELPKPDIILLSHAHMDHTDYSTLKIITEKWPQQIDVVTAYLTSDVIENLGWRTITVLDWEERTSLSGVDISALEVEHFGWRFPWEKDRSRGYYKDGRSYNAYLMERNGNKILFAGDTRYTQKLDKLSKEQVDIAFMPIGAYNPWKSAHCNPEEALMMAERMNAKYFIPMHCKTFRQGSEPFNEPIDWMNKSSSKYNLKIGLDEIGKTFTFMDK